MKREEKQVVINFWMEFVDEHKLAPRNMFHVQYKQTIIKNGNLCNDINVFLEKILAPGSAKTI